MTQQLACYYLCSLVFLVSVIWSNAAYVWPKNAISSLNETTSLSPEFVTHYYTQTLDHFNYKPESYLTFQQKYILNSKYWGGSDEGYPIFVYTGQELDVVSLVGYNGFLVDIATHFKGLLIYIEHRYYGDSMPFGSEDNAFKDATTLGFCSSEQALADYAELIIDLKKNLSAENCPTIAVGGSYGGMLASWFRLKYPHIVYAALASSAPILYFDDLTPQNGYHVKVTQDFRNTSESCYKAITQSWLEIDRVAAEPNGLLKLSNIFSTCKPLNSTTQLQNYLEIRYIAAAQYDYPPDYPVNKICEAIDTAPKNAYILTKIAAGVNASRGPMPCQDIHERTPSNKDGWQWQSCTEMVFPIGYGANETMFKPSPFSMDDYTKTCQQLFGITPRPHWITTEYGGHGIKFVLKKFASNILFSNGLRDPYSVGGVLYNISDTILAVYAEKGAHVLDLRGPEASDPSWLIEMRKSELSILRDWIVKYKCSEY